MGDIGKLESEKAIFEILLTAEALRQDTTLRVDDIPPRIRSLFLASQDGSIEEIPAISEPFLKEQAGIEGAHAVISKNPFVQYEDFGQRFHLQAFVPALKWYVTHGGTDNIRSNPALSRFADKEGWDGFSYETAKSGNPKFEETREYIRGKVEAVLKDNEEMQTARDLTIIYAPEEIEFTIDNLVCTHQQEEMIQKIRVAKEHLAFLNERQIYEFGKILFVGPPGTGKTSLALAMSRALGMPMLEVRLAMITSQYLGETAKNIDRIFELARKVSPCILFIDEFDYVAKSRITDDNAAMKRAVNMILKNIDTVSFVKNSVLLIGATNHPQVLDEAAWRRFDEIVPFYLPDTDMREKILHKITARLDCDVNFRILAEATEGFSGADLRILIKESIISALMRNDDKITEEDIAIGMAKVDERNQIRFNGGSKTIHS
jgi:SpoVK/Ycf46/Vps4 family AAA+-type ATPase